MAQTRGATGNAKPRVFTPVSTEPVRKRKTGTAATKKTTTSKPKATGGVKKKRAPAAAKKPTIKDKVEGAVEKVVGTAEGKPSKKAAGTKKMKAGKPAKPVATV